MTSNYEKLETASKQYEELCLLAAAAEVDLFTPLTQQALSANALSARIQTQPKATVIVLDALTALGYLGKSDETEPRYRVAEEFRELLDIGHPRTFIPMLRHRINCMRNWQQLSVILRTGQVAQKTASPLGVDEDYRSFVLAMNSVGVVFAQRVADHLQQAKLLNFKRMLDVGGASGTYTLAFLERNPQAEAILFDRPAAVEEARKRFAKTPFVGQVQFVGGDFGKDSLPKGADFAWVSAIIHQFGRDQAQALYRNVHQALENGGTIAIRDFVMDSTHTQPTGGTLFAVNMLTATANGRCYTFDEIGEDLRSAGFSEVRLAVPEKSMGAVVTARK
ncbi:MAG: methyltransferase domain-containing protein [Candidatus Accumulibacter sp.]|jgi:SAM-dependent methyltransferase|nr:methyltransferase domain-containing protein [Accumulibacter sp.]